MSLLVTGTLAFDSVETPYEVRDEAIGGSATYAAWAASFFGPVRLVSVVGTDFPDQATADLRSRGIDTEGLEVAAGKTFRWGGSYAKDWNTRTTKFTDLNVLATFDPKLPQSFRDSRFVFLANASPEVQQKALDQCSNPEFVICDTMNLWIDIAREGLVELLKRVDAVVMNDEEAVLLTGERTLVKAARHILAMGPRMVLIKKGEHGAMLVTPEALFCLPAYPVADVVDPTGAGDSFAGGFLGYLASVENTQLHTLRRAMLYGTVTASIAVEGFSVEAFREHSRGTIERRFNELVAIVTI
ncbi:MAG: PfkB family carbohydrate kinase [Planctomycetota bacterium]